MSIIERATLAVADELKRQEPEKGGTYWVDARDLKAAVIDGTFDLSAVAIAVMTAIREPSEAILGAMSDTLPVSGYEWERDEDEMVPHWQAMIDAALSEGD